MAMRRSIIDAGGEVHFGAGRPSAARRQVCAGSLDTNGAVFESSQIVLATGHSARDVYSLLKKEKIRLTRNRLLSVCALSIRKPQLINSSIIIPKASFCHKLLPAASYRLATKIDDRGVHFLHVSGWIYRSRCH